MNPSQKDTSSIPEIIGNFDHAIQQLIADLVDSKRSYTNILYRWDQTRGNDWFISTRKSESNTKA